MKTKVTETRGGGGQKTTTTTATTWLHLVHIGSSHLVDVKLIMKSMYLIVTIINGYNI